ncbi:hypothetical protein BDR26DRAFT_919557 [Obelidium mucronatum]|nr:hypothetical protein BDR26DRAFT_919557 [Obelidium mucronatum]
MNLEPLARSFADSGKHGARMRVAPSSLQWETRPVENYRFAPPAAPKYYLWDNTPLGPTLVCDTKRLGIASIRIHACAYTALVACARNSPSKESIGFLLGRLTNSELFDGLLSHPEPEYIVSLDGTILLKKVLVLDRFDAGRKFHSKEDMLTPTVELPGDVIVKVANANLKSLGLHSLFEGIMKDLNNNADIKAPFPIIIQFDHEKQLLIGRQLIPSYKLLISPINSIRIVPTTSYLNVIATLGSHDSSSMDFGYLTIDQARHVLLLTQDDKLAFQLPLIGIWIKNASGVTTVDVQYICTRFLTDTRLRRLDTGKGVMVVLMLKAEPSNPRLSPSSRGSKSTTDSVKVAQFYECLVEQDPQYFSVNGDSKRPVNFDGHGSAAETGLLDDDIVTVLQMTNLDLSQESDIVQAIESYYKIELPVSATVPITIPSITPSTAESLEASFIECNRKTEEASQGIANITNTNPLPDPDHQPTVATTSSSELNQLEPPSTKEQVPDPDNQPTVATTSSTESNQLEPHLDPFQLMQQQQTHMYMMLMQRQYEMVLALTNTANAKLATFPPFLGSPSCPVLPIGLTNVSTASASCSTQTASVRTIGTNTSFAFLESHQSKDEHMPRTDVGVQIQMTQVPREATFNASSSSISATSTIPTKLVKKPAADFNPPNDTGSNYKPLFTFDSIPVQSVDQTINLASSVGPAANARQLVREPLSNYNRICHRPPTYPLGVNSIGGNAIGSATRKSLSNLACDTSRLSARDKEVSNSDVLSSDYMRLRSNGKAAGMVAARKNGTGLGLDSQIMISLDLSGIENNDVMGNRTFEEFEPSTSSELEDERTRELIAQLVENPEQSFIFCDVSRHEIGTISRKQNEGFKLDSGQDKHEFADKPEYALNARLGRDDVSSTREQFSKATLEYLAKYRLTE